MHKILFVCLGNICRSPMAEFVMKKMVKDAGVEAQFEEYFQSFFATGGEFQKYASIIEGTTEIAKIGREYKVGVVVSVRKDDLRKALEAAGVIKGLNSGF